MMKAKVLTKNKMQRKCLHKVAFAWYYDDSDLVLEEDANDMYSNNVKFNFCPMCGAAIAWEEN